MKQGLNLKALRIRRWALISTFLGFWLSAEVQAATFESLSASFQTSYYLQDPLNNNALAQNAYTSLLLNLQADRKWSYHQLRIVASGAVGLNCKSCTFLEAPEAFYSYSADENNRITVGRKLKSWSLLDQYWKLGIWQPRFIQDELRPIEAGLLGVHLDLRASKLLMFNALISPVFLPERGTQFAFRNDRLIRGDSPWFLSPPRNVNIFSKETEIEYELAGVDESNIVFNPSIALQAIYGKLENGSWIRLNYAFKPRNQIAAFFDPSLRIVKAHVDIYPTPQFHHVYGAELGSHTSNSSFWIGAQNVHFAKVDSGELPRTAFSDALEGNTTYLAAFASRKLNFIRPLRRAIVTTAWLHQFNSAHPSSDAEGVSLNGVSSQGYSSAVKGQFLLPLMGTWNLTTSILHGIQSSDTVLSFEGTYVESKNLTVSLALDFLSDASNPERSIWGRFRGNDRITGSFSYVF